MTELGEAIRLFTVQSEEGQVDSVVPLRWCISRETAEMLERKEAYRPDMLIIVTHGNRETGRYIVPLTAEMQYVRFRHPGKNTVHATIVWPQGFSGDSPRKTLKGEHVLDSYHPGEEDLEEQLDVLQAELDVYGDADEAPRRLLSRARAVRDQLEELWRSPATARINPELGEHYHLEQLNFTAELDVEVPKQMFAKEPPGWVRWLSRCYWKSSPRDQCQLRRRALIAGVTSPLWLIATSLLALVLEVVKLLAAAVLLLFGVRKVDFSPFLHPLGHPARMWEHAENPVWWYKKVPVKPLASGDKPYEYRERPPIFWVLNPPVALLALVLWRWLPDRYFYWAAGILLAVFILTLFFTFTSDTLEELQLRWSQWRKRRQEAAERQRQEQFARELELIACNGGPRQANLRALPKQRRTVWLRFQDVKAKVCKPFPG